MKRTLALAALLTATSVLLADDIDPFGFEKEHSVSSKSRAEVVSELKAAQANDEMPRAGELGVKFVDAPSTKSRAQVVAETREAARLGLLGGYGELGPKVATPQQERQIETAGLRAAGRVAASTK